MAELTFALPDLDGLDADALVVGTFSAGSRGEGVRLAPGAEAADAALDGRLLAALTAVGASGAEDDVVKVAAAGSSPVPLIVAVGLGAAPADGTAPDPQRVARAAGSAVRALAGKSKVALALGLAGGEAAAAGLIAAVAEGALLGAYAFEAYRTGDRSRSAPPGQLTLLVPDPKADGLDAAARRAGIVAGAVALARDLVNSPPNDLPPAELARRAEEAALAGGLDVEVLDERSLAAAGFGGVLGVGGGSARPPRLVRLRHAGTGPKVALVGKGITFDSGGISIKPAVGMDQMKADMAGAAAVVAVMTAIAALDLPLDVTATVPMAENLPSGSAYRPADVLTMYGGKKVEVLNTDAEGRLILADAIVRACEDSPEYLIETSTLTGAQRIALGDRTSGVMGTEELRDRVVAAGARVGEDMWPMPLPDYLRSGLDSKVADIANVTGERAAGMLAAGVFLREFVAEGVQWAHIDMASPAYNTGRPWGYTPKGGTGVPVRTILTALEDICGTD
ncbi:MAG: Cytosol aminopeptidase PepA [uncultured Corynebacteriales bacterium]|uniref:Probable cytosol aminopeptidase n=1 Tax=uncultured Mycobacteriales bacterium TaxID=581187 RepID=A0A6J4HZ12_9ACTN|nr:MAG: Cytosol aminopeptidase PepA [uncultured Corynebacteriales bacterium]